MTKEDCLFCQIINGQIPAYRIYEDEDFIAFLDVKPINLGHSLIVPKKHYRNLFDLPTELLNKLGITIQALALAVKNGTQADGLNVSWNNEPAAGQIIFHAHIHLIPRFEGDGLKHWQGSNKESETAFKNTQKDITECLEEKLISQNN